VIGQSQTHDIIAIVSWLILCMIAKYDFIFRITKKHYYCCCYVTVHIADGNCVNDICFCKFSVQESEFRVKNVQVRAGYILHIGNVEGTLRIGDHLKCCIDEVNRFMF